MYKIRRKTWQNISEIERPCNFRVTREAENGTPQARCMNGHRKTDWLIWPDWKSLPGEKQNKIKNLLTCIVYSQKTWFTSMKGRNWSSKASTLVDLNQFYVTLLIVDIGINDIENTTSRHNAVFSSFIKTIKPFFSPQNRWESRMKPTGEIYTNWVLLPKELRKLERSVFCIN